MPGIYTNDDCTAHTTVVLFAMKWKCGSEQLTGKKKWIVQM
jgi:hypothetical protein